MARVMGAPAAHIEPVLSEVESAARAGFAFIVYGDGEDCFAVIGQEGDTPADVQRLGAELVA